MQTPVTRKTIKDHLTYSWWKYVILVVVAFMAWSIIYTVTAYKPPEEKKIVLGAMCSGTEQYLTAYMEDVRQEKMPDMELIDALCFTPDGANDEVILTTHIVAKDCDIYILPETQFKNWAAKGAFMKLDVKLPELVAYLEAEGINLNSGMCASEGDDTLSLYGIPCRSIPGMEQILYTDATDLYLCVFHDTGNDANVLKFTDIFVRDMLAVPAAE